MEKNNDMTNYHNGSPLPSQESEEGSDGWLKWLKSNKRIRKDLPITRPVDQGINLRKESTIEENKFDPHLPDDRGESRDTIL